MHVTVHENEMPKGYLGPVTVHLFLLIAAVSICPSANIIHFSLSRTWLDLPSTWWQCSVMVNQTAGTNSPQDTGVISLHNLNLIGYSNYPAV